MASDGRGGRTALYRIKLDGSLTRERVLGRSDVDVDDLVTIGRSRVVGVSYATDKRVVEFFDPELAKLAAALHKALPGQPQISFVDASADESRLLLLASGDTDPGMYYVFDKKTRKLEQVLGLRPELEGVKLAPMQAISYRAADGTMIPAYLTLPPGHNPGDSSGKGLPAIVMPHGGPSARDEWGSTGWSSSTLRGYAVLQPNYRGSSGLGSTGRTGTRSSPGAGHCRYRRCRALVAGPGDCRAGQAGDRGLVLWRLCRAAIGVVDPGLFKAIVAVAPVTDLPRLRDDQMAYTNGVIVGRQIGEGDSLKGASPALNAGAFTVPVLLFHGDQDLNVPVAQSREMADRLRPTGHLAAYVEFKGLITSSKAPQARTRILSDSDALLRKAMGLKP
jgi:dipeptidyl aminopeptidase/acylaminoacyl peptidase